MKTKLYFKTFLLVFFTSLYASFAFGNEVRETVIVGSKNSTESVILGEMIGHLVKEAGNDVKHKRQLGGTRVLWDALVNGEIDVYPEYTGTLQFELLADENLQTREQIIEALAVRDLRMTKPLGFNNTYAIGIKERLGKELDLHKISDLKNHPDLILGFW